MEKIAFCGDDCFSCPRYSAKTNDELQKTAELWYRVGWRDSIVTNEEIMCNGCSSDKECTYGLIDCITGRKIEKCSECGEFPCKKIDEMLVCSENYEKKCKEVCAKEEYDMLKNAFFSKEKNLRKQV